MRFIFLAFLALAAVAAISGAWPARRTLQAVIALIILYAVLKMTGVIEAIAPDRNGVF